ncbi:MAG: hypothetical protein ABI231_04350 [Candidatus Tumulicola sp.]
MGDFFNQDISNAAMDPNSAAVISHLPNLTAGNFPGQRYFQVNLSNNTESVPLNFLHSGGYFPGMISVPWKSSFWISPLNDGHAVSLNTDTCQEYDFYQASFDGSTLTAHGGREWNLNQPISAQYAQQQHSWGADAADLPYADLMLVGEDAFGPGPIQHAIGFYFPTGQGIEALHYYRPADSYTLVGGCSAEPCMGYGDRFRLKVSYVCPGTFQGDRICAALKSYGMFYYDQAGSFGLLFGASTDGSFPWNGGQVDALLNNLHMSDFDMLTRGATGP